MSKSIAEPLLSNAEFGLVVFAAIILIGLIGQYLIERRKATRIPDHIEYPNSAGHYGRPKRQWNWARILMWIGIAGIIGELVCDAVIWESSSSLWIIADNDLKTALALAGPRNIHGTEERLVIKSALERFPRIPYDLSLPPVTDRKPGQLELLEPSSFLVEHLIVVLSVLSGWKLQSVQGDIPKTRLPAAITLLTMLQDEKSSRGAPVPVINLGQVSGLFGVKIVVPFEETILRDAAYALAQALNKIHIETDVDLPAPYNNIKTNLVTGNAVHIIIGVEP